MLRKTLIFLQLYYVDIDLDLYWAFYFLYKKYIYFNAFFITTLFTPQVHLHFSFHQCGLVFVSVVNGSSVSEKKSFRRNWVSSCRSTAFSLALIAKKNQEKEISLLSFRLTCTTYENVHVKSKSSIKGFFPLFFKY